MKPWEKYQGGGEAEAQSGPWSKYQAKAPEPSFGESLLSGIVSVGEAFDRYADAPARAALSSLQDDVSSPGKAVRAFADQFGEDPSLAPSGQDLVVKGGVPNRDYRFHAKEPSPADPDFYRYNNDPAFREEYMRSGKGSEIVVNPSKSAGLAMEMVASPVNLVPFGLISKGVASGTAKLASRGVNAAADVAAGVGNAASKVGKRVVQGALGVPEESINRYIARHADLKDKVGAREMMEELAGRLDEGLKPARAELEAAEAAVERAKSSRTEDLAELQIKRQDAAEALRRAEDDALGEAASRVSSRVQMLDEKVKAGSSKSFEILDREGAVVPTKELKARMTAGIKALEERAVTDEQMAVVELLGRYRERLDKFGSEIPGAEAKRIIQALDREMSHLAPGEIGRMSKPDQALGALRGHIDAPLKKSPAYAEQMAEVSRIMRILEDTKGLASDGAAAKALKAARGATGADRAEAIQKLASEFGDDFLAAADRRNLPEYHKLKTLLHRVRAAKKGEGLKASELALEAKRAEVGDAVRLGKDGVAGITDKINATVRSSTPNAVQVENLKKVGNMTGVDMAEELADLRTIASFEKGYNRGSANTNFWGAVAGGIFGSVFGPGGIIGGAAAGGAFGRLLIDNFGPKVARVILDQTPNLRKVSPSKWIRSLDVSPAVQAKLAQDLIAYEQISRGTKGGAATLRSIHGSEMRRVAEDEESRVDRRPSTPKGGPDRWASTGADKLGLSQSDRARLMQSKQGKQLLIEASDLKSDSPRLKKIREQIKRVK